MLETFKSLFGAYEPIANTVTEVVGNQTIEVVKYSIDWGYIFYAGMILIMVAGAFKLLRAIVGKEWKK